MHASSALTDEIVEEDPWHKAYLPLGEQKQEHTIAVTEHDEIAFGQEPRQAILVVGPSGVGTWLPKNEAACVYSCS